MNIRNRAIEKYRKDGVIGIIKRAPTFIQEETKPQRNKLGGKLIELKGNQLEYKGINLDLLNFAISTQLKGRFIFNEYETQEAEFTEKYLPTDLPVIELGGCIGFTACKINKKLDRPEEHIVLEANPKLIPTLEKNRELNNAKFEILNKAYRPGRKNVTFNIHDKFVGGSVQRETGEKITVQSTDLKEILERKNWNEFVLVCDIEGGEYNLNQESKLLSQAEVAIIEIHDFIDDEFQITLEEVDSKNNCHVFKNKD